MAAPPTAAAGQGAAAAIVRAAAAAAATVAVASEASEASDALPPVERVRDQDEVSEGGSVGRRHEWLAGGPTFGGLVVQGLPRRDHGPL